MSSWRDSASAECQADLDNLLNAALPATKHLLAKNGEFFPFGFVIGNSTDPEMIAGYTGTEHPLSTEVLALLYEGLAQRAGEIRGAAVVSDVRLNSGSDAIRVELEHRDGVAIGVVLPYRKKRFGGGIDYGDLSGLEADRRIWPPTTS